MSVQISQVYQFTDNTSFDPRKLQWELNGIAAAINSANAGTLTWDNVKAASITDTGLTASTAVVCDANKQLISSATTSAELAFVHGVTSAIQTQINSKATLTLPVSIANGGTNSIAALSNGRVMGSVGGAVVELSLGQVPGTATNDSASVGNVGEIISGSKLRSAATSITTATPANAASISLTAGDWEIFWGAGVKAGGATTYTLLFMGISTTSATLSGGDNYVVPDATGQVNIIQQGSFAPGSGNDIALAGMPARISLASTTTYFLVVRADFSGSTSTFYGSLHARRLR